MESAVETLNTGSSVADIVPAPQPSLSIASSNCELPDAPARTKAKKIIVLTALYIALFPATLDATIVSTAIPTISNYFHTASGYAWIGSAYLLASAASTPLWARFSDIWGRKLAWLGTLFVFFVSSILCATAVDMPMLIAGRAIQGAAAGGIQLLVAICISDLVSMRHRGFFTSLMGVVWAVSDAVGPILGGVFSETTSWRYCWWVNLPVTGGAFIAIYVFFDLHNPKTSFKDGIKAIDWLGSIAIVASAVMFLLGLDFGSTAFSWASPKVVCLIVFGIAMVAMFVLGEAKIAQHPLVPPRLFSHPSNVATLFMTFSHGFVHIAGEYFLPLFFQSVYAASPIRSGLLLIPLAFCQSLGGIIYGVISSKTGHYIAQARVGMFLMTLSFGLFITFDASTPLSRIIGLEVLAGLSVGLGFSPPFTAIATTVPQQDRAAALGTVGFSRTFAQALSVVIGDVVFQARMRSHQSHLRSVLPAATAALFTGDSAAASVQHIASLPEEARGVVRAAYSDSLSDMWILYTCVAFFGAICTLFMEHRRLDREHVETKTGIDQMLGRQKEKGEQEAVEMT